MKQTMNRSMDMTNTIVSMAYRRTHGLPSHTQLTVLHGQRQPHYDKVSLLNTKVAYTMKADVQCGRRTWIALRGLRRPQYTLRQPHPAAVGCRTSHKNAANRALLCDPRHLHHFLPSRKRDERKRKREKGERVLQLFRCMRINMLKRNGI